MKLVRSRGEVRRMELTARVQRPAGATKLSDVGKALEAWDTDVREFVEAGGRPQTFDDRRNALIMILPPDIRTNLLMHMHMLEPPKSCEDLHKAHTLLHKTL